MRLILLLCLVLFIVPAHSQENKPRGEMTLGAIRTKLLGKKIIINPGPYTRRGDLLYWKVARREGGEYTADILHALPSNYQNQEAEVVAVQLNELKRGKVAQPNALGETISDDALVDPYCDVVVKFADGAYAMVTSYPISLFSEMSAPFKMASERRARAEAITTQLPTIVGKTVYAVAYSRLYPVTATAEDIFSSSGELTRTFDFPRLQPLTITIAKYDETHDAIILKLKDQNGTEYLTRSDFLRSQEAKDFITSVVGSFPANLLTSMPNHNPRELEAIRTGSIYQGMSMSALYKSVGFPDKKNDWGRGGQQLIYAGGRILVYVDSAERVADWQTLSR